MNVSISKKEYLKLQDAQEKLSLLEAGGVDNWEGYSISLEDYTPTSELYTEAEELLNELADNTQINYPAKRDTKHQVIFSKNAIEKIVQLLKNKK